MNTVMNDATTCRASIPHGDSFISRASDEDVGIRQKLDGIH